MLRTRAPLHLALSFPWRGKHIASGYDPERDTSILLPDRCLLPGPGARPCMEGGRELRRGALLRQDRWSPDPEWVLPITVQLGQGWPSEKPPPGHTCLAWAHSGSPLAGQTDRLLERGAGHWQVMLHFVMITADTYHACLYQAMC